MDLGLFEKSMYRPSGRGGWTLDFSESPTDPLGRGGLVLDLGLQKVERIHILGGRGYKVALVDGAGAAHIIGN